jgi:DNA adenine methylase
LKPFVKWAGGKRQIIDIILEKIKDSTKYDNKESYRFIEPFVGGGVVFLSLNNDKTIINDLNSELMKTYRTIRDNPDALMSRLDELYRLFQERGEDFYYEIRRMDRNADFECLSDLEIAARFIFLNKTCYNGLYRVNAAGFFNTPIGRNSIKSFYDKKNILAISAYLNKPDVVIMNGSYVDAIRKAGMGDVVYIDPPYDYKENDGFTSYQKSGFSFKDFLELKRECDAALERGAYVIISNNYTDKVVKEFTNDKQHYYEYYDVMSLATKRSINCKANLRNNGEEILIWGIPCAFPYIKNVESLFPLIKIRNKDMISDFDFLDKRFSKYPHKTIVHMVSSLKFLGIINSKNDFTDCGLQLRKMKTGSDEFKKEFALAIRRNIVFTKLYIEATNNGGWSLTIDEIAKDLVEQYPGISVGLAKRRAQIVKIWISWSNDVLN